MRGFFCDLKIQILMLDVGFMFESLAMGKFERSEIDGIGVIEESEWLGAILNRGNGTANNRFLVRLSDMGAGVTREEEFAWRNEATIGWPKVRKYGRNDTAVHMSRDEEVKFIEIAINFGIEKMDG